MTRYTMEALYIALAIALIVIATVAVWWRTRAYPAGAPSAQWDLAGGYSCPGSVVSGWCILPDAASAKKTCDADPKCVGYIAPGSGSHWGQPAGSVQLVAVPPSAAPGYDGTVFYKKP